MLSKMPPRSSLHRELLPCRTKATLTPTAALGNVCSPKPCLATVQAQQSRCLLLGLSASAVPTQKALLTSCQLLHSALHSFHLTQQLFHTPTFYPNPSPAFLHRTYYLALSLCPPLDCRLSRTDFCLCSLLSPWPLHSAWLTHNGRMGRGGGCDTLQVLTRLSTVTVLVVFIF